MSEARTAPAVLPPVPADEAARLGALHRYGVLDTPPEAAFDRLTRLAARLFDVPIVLVSLVDETRQWFKSCHGLDSTGTPRGQAFCAHAIVQPGALLEVLDPESDPRFAANPLVTGPPGIRYYAGVPLVTPDGRALGTFCLIDRRRRPPLSEAERESLATLAASAVSELELRRERLDRVLAARAADDLGALVAERLGDLAHELKTPLTAVLGYSQMLASSAARPEATARYVAGIERAGQHMVALVDRLLRPPRQGGAAVGGPELDALPVLPLLEEVAELVAPLAARHGMTIKATATPDLPPVAADALRLRQILINFATNAVKYAGTGAIRLAAAPAAGGRLRLSVADQGPGIDLDDQARLFEAGVRLSGTESAEGFGKGLALARLAARTMGGAVGVDSAPGAGATFWVELPVA